MFDNKFLDPTWYSAPWPYQHNNSETIDLQLITPDYKDIPLYQCPIEYRSTVKKLPPEKQHRTNLYPRWPEGSKSKDEAEEDPAYLKALAQYKKGPSERSLKVPVIRLMSAPNNGSATAVRVHGWRPYLYVPVPDEWSKILLQNQFPEIANYPYGNGTRYQLPQDDLEEKKKGWPNVRADRDRKIAKNKMAIRYATQFQDALETAVQKKFTNELKWVTGDFTYATILSVVPVLRQDVYGFDFDEQKLFFKVTVSVQKVVHLIKKLLVEGMACAGLNYQLTEDLFYNATSTPEMLFMIENKLTGMTWYTLQAQTYSIVTGALPEERRSGVYTGAEGAEGVDDDTKGALDGVNLDAELACVEDAEGEGVDAAYDEIMAHMQEDDAQIDEENEKKRKTWCRAEIDTHFHSIQSHWRESATETETKLIETLTTSYDLIKKALAKCNDDEDQAMQLILNDKKSLFAQKVADKATEMAPMAENEKFIESVKDRLARKVAELEKPKFSLTPPSKIEKSPKEISLEERLRIDLALAKHALQTYQNFNIAVETLTSRDLSRRKQLENDITKSVKLQDPLWNRSANLTTVAWDLECSNRGNHFPDANLDAILAISMVKKELASNKEDSITLTWEKPINKDLIIPDAEHPNILTLKESKVVILKNEKDMLLYFLTAFRSGQFAKNTGYNIFKFDWPYILRRAQVLGIKSFPLISPYRECISAKNTFFESSAAGQRIGVEVKCNGTIIYDLLNWAKNELKLKSNSLNAVATHVLGGTKDDLHHSLIKKMFWGKRKDRERLLHYNWKDSKLVIDIMWDKKNLLWLRNTEICRVCGVTISDLILRGQGIKTESQLHRIMLARGFLAPNKSKSVVQGEKSGHSADGQELADAEFDSELSNDDKYKGATCIHPKIGWYTDPIITLDFQSLYPSIMSAYNLSYDTLIKCDEDRARLNPDDYTAIETVSGENDEIVTIFYFVKAHIRKGLVCELVDYLLYQRNEVVKKEIKKFTLLGKSTDLLNARSTALKLANNSTYGFCLVEGTQVALANGTSVPIEKVPVGAFVYGLGDAKGKQLIPRQVTAVLNQGVKDCIELEFSDGRTLCCTRDHKILTSTGEWIEADKLIVGNSSVVVKNDQIRYATSLAQLVAKRDYGMRQVWDLTVPALNDDIEPAFVANGIVVHNCAGYRLFLAAISICVCAIGRLNLVNVQEVIETKFTIANGYPGNAYIVYGDTDSVMVRVCIMVKDPRDKKELAEAVKLANVVGDEMQDACNELFINHAPIFLDKEKCYVPFYLAGKKNYHGLKYDADMYPGMLVLDEKRPGHTKEYQPKADAKGIESQRRDKVAFIQRVLTQVIKMSHQFVPVMEILQYMYNENEKLCKDELDLSEIIQSKSVRVTYASLSIQTVLINKQLERGLPPAVAGDRVYFVPVKTSGESKGTEIGEDPNYVIENNLKVDYQAIGKSCIKNAQKRLVYLLILKEFCPTFVPKYLDDTDKKQHLKPEPLPERCQELLDWLYSPFTREYPDFDRKYGGALMKSVKRLDTCRICGIVLNPSNSSGGRKGCRTFCNKHAGQFDKFDVEYRGKVETWKKDLDQIWDNCNKCVGPEGDSKGCKTTECGALWRRRKLATNLENVNEYFERLQITDW